MSAWERLNKTEIYIEGGDGTILVWKNNITEFVWPPIPSSISSWERKSFKPLQARHGTSPDILQLTISPRAFVKLPGGLGQLWSRDPLCQTPCSATHCRVVRLPQTCVDIPGCAALHLNYRRITSDHSECKYCARARIMIKSRLKDSFTYSWLLAMAWIMSIIKLWPLWTIKLCSNRRFQTV